MVVLPHDEMMNQNSYLELLCDYLPSCFEKCSAEVFQQDGAPCLTAKSVTQWLSDCQVNFISDWPSNSPDLSPIQNLWSIIKQGKDTSTLTKLETAINEEWLNFDHTILKNLANSLPSRLKVCIRRKGKRLLSDSKYRFDFIFQYYSYCLSTESFNIIHAVYQPSRGRIMQ